MKKITIAHTIRVMLPIAVKVAPVRFFLINFFGIAQSAVLAVNTLLLSRFVDALIASVSKGEVGESLILWISLYVAGIIDTRFLTPFLTIFWTNTGKYVMKNSDLNTTGLSLICRR